MSNDHKDDTQPDTSSLETTSESKPDDAPAIAADDTRIDSKTKSTKAAAAAKQRRRGGHKTPPVDTQFKPGQSGNPSGKRKKPQLPRHIGNQIDGITVAIIAELNHIMMHGIPKGMPTGPYAGAKLYARTFYKDATTKDGYARKRLYALYHENRQYLDVFRAKDKSAADAEDLSMMIRAVIDPTLTEQEYKEILNKLGEGKSERYKLE